MALRNEVIAVEMIDVARRRLEQALSLPETLAASWRAFEVAWAVSSACAERGSALFPAFQTAVLAACRGLDSLCSAPSMTLDLPALPDTADPGELDEQECCDLLADLTLALSRRLRAAARDATDPHDRDACDEGADAADELRDVLTGTG
jgi:hypothetical protein